MSKLTRVDNSIVLLKMGNTHELKYSKILKKKINIYKVKYDTNA